MKKSKLLFSTFVLALTLMFLGVTTSTYADATDPQGTTNSIKAPPPPPPPPPDKTILAQIWDALVAALS